MAKCYGESLKKKASGFALNTADLACFLANTVILGHDYEEIGNSEVARSFYAFSHLAVGGLSTLLLGLRTKGLENVPAQGRAVISCNHLHASDVLFVPSSIPHRHVTPVGRSAVMNKNIQGDIFRAWGAVTINRPAKGESFSLEGLYTMEAPLKENRLELIFDPHRTPGAKPGLTPRGVLRVAQDTESPIIPTVIKGSDRLFKNWGVVISYGEPQPYPTHRKEHRELQHHLMEIKQEMFDEIPYTFEYGEPEEFELGTDV